MIVDRINAFLTAEMKPLPEVLLDEVAALARNAFMRQFGEREDKPGTIRLSSIGRCLRQQAYKLHNFEESGKTIDSRAKMVFFMGDLCELAVVSLAKAAGCNITACGADQKKIEVDGIKGYPDGLVEVDGKMHLLEVKSMSSYGFKEFEQGEIDISYRYQVNAYMHALGLEQAIMVALNKDAGVLGEMLVRRDPDIILDIRERIDTLRRSTPEDLPTGDTSLTKKGTCHGNVHIVICVIDADPISKKYWSGNLINTSSQQTVKKCNRCTVARPACDFFRNPSENNPDRLASRCKGCVKIEAREYRERNREKYNAIHRAVRAKKVDYYRAIARRKSAEWRRKYPWYQSFYMAKARCENLNWKAYKYYGARGIRFLLTKEEIKNLWERDRGHMLLRPSIDRIDPRGNYEFSNCRFIELGENSRIARLGKRQKTGPRKNKPHHCKRNHIYSPENTSVNKLGFRKCKTCSRKRWNEWRDPAKEKVRMQIYMNKNRTAVNQRRREKRLQRKLYVPKTTKEEITK